MKKSSIGIIVMLAFVSLKAQTSKEENDYIQAMFGMEKRAAVKDFVKLTPAEEAACWTNYDEYEIKRKEMGKERIELLDIFTLKFETITDQESIDWMKSLMSLRDRDEKLIGKYYQKILKECSPVVAIKFYQLESDVLSGIRYQILENIAF